MVASLLAFFLQLDTKFVQVAPAPSDESKIERWDGQRRAVLLIHGIRPHPFSAEKVEEAVLHSWQKAGSDLVDELSKESDVFAFAYGQNVPVDDVAEAPGLAAAIKRLKDAGYAEIVIVGHSAGGIVARDFVEDHPDAGVTKVVQTCAPNAGSFWGRSEFAVRKNQEAFLNSLSKEARQKRGDKKIPDAVQFVCVVGDGTGVGDGVVSDDSQWPEDLRKQGIPAIQVRTIHFAAVRSRSVAEKIAELIRDDQPRWDEKKVEAARKKLLD